MDEIKNIKTVIIAIIIYVSLMIFSNLGSLRALSLAGMSVDGGALLYPLTFTLRDILHKKAGAALTRVAIWMSALMNLALFAFVWLIGILPADMSVGAQTEYALVLSPGIRLVLASVLAMLMAELLDTFIYSTVRRKWGGRRQYLRTLISNAVSAPVDTAVFLAVAFLGRYPLPVLISMFFANIIIKYAVTLVSCWGVYLVKEDRE